MNLKDLLNMWKEGEKAVGGAFNNAVQAPFRVGQQAGRSLEEMLKVPEVSNQRRNMVNDPFDSTFGGMLNKQTADEEYPTSSYELKPPFMTRLQEKRPDIKPGGFADMTYKDKYNMTPQQLDATRNIPIHYGEPGQTQDMSQSSGGYYNWRPQDNNEGSITLNSNYNSPYMPPVLRQQELNQPDVLPHELAHGIFQRMRQQDPNVDKNFAQDLKNYAPSLYNYGVSRVSNPLYKGKVNPTELYAYTFMNAKKNGISPELRKYYY